MKLTTHLNLVQSSDWVELHLYFALNALTLNLLTTTIVAPPSNASKWQMGFNSAFKGLMACTVATVLLGMQAHLNCVTIFSCSGSCC